MGGWVGGWVGNARNTGVVCGGTGIQKTGGWVGGVQAAGASHAAVGVHSPAGAPRRKGICRVDTAAGAPQGAPARRSNGRGVLSARGKWQVGGCRLEANGRWEGNKSRLGLPGRAEPSELANKTNHAVNGKTNVAVQLGGWWVSGVLAWPMARGTAASAAEGRGRWEGAQRAALVRQE